MKTTSRTALEKDLLKSEIPAEMNIARALFLLKRLFDHWSLENLKKEGYPEVKISYMPFLMNIGAKGISNNELAKRFGHTKQAMSKTLKELEQQALIYFEPHPTDARSSLVFLTDKGIHLVLHTRKKVRNLISKYSSLLGEKKYKTMLAGMYDIIGFHQQVEE